jgi:hypothetical protein
VDEEFRYAGTKESTAISSLINGDYQDDWLNAKLAERRSNRDSNSSSTTTASLKAIGDVKDDEKSRVPFKMKRFANVQSKVAAMGFF